MNIADQSNSIRSREDFVAFVRALSNDFKEHPESWENKDLPRFLEALGAWVQDMDGYYRSQGKPTPGQLDWKIFADILMAAKMYE